MVVTLDSMLEAALSDAALASEEIYESRQKAMPTDSFGKVRFAVIRRRLSRHCQSSKDNPGTRLNSEVL